MIKKIGLSLTISTALFTGAVTAAVEEIVTVATRTEANLAEVIGSVSVVDGDALKLVSHAHVQQALSRVAGVNLHRGNGQEYLPAVRSPVLTGAGGCWLSLAWWQHSILRLPTCASHGCIKPHARGASGACT